MHICCNEHLLSTVEMILCYIDSRLTLQVSYLVVEYQNESHFL